MLILTAIGMYINILIDNKNLDLPEYVDICF